MMLLIITKQHFFCNALEQSNHIVHVVEVVVDLRTLCCLSADACSVRRLFVVSAVCHFI